MSRHLDFPNPNDNHARGQQPQYRRWRRHGVVAWAGLVAVGWLGYLAFLGGFPGNYWVAQVYSIFLSPLVAVGLTAILTAPIFGLAFGLLAIASLKTGWRSRTRQGVKTLLLMLLVEVMAIAALLPSGLLVGDVTDRLVVSPWQATYRAIYVSPLDDNYGDLILLKCHWFSFCRQVYRRYTDIGSSEKAYLQFDPEANQVKLHLEGRWVYVRSPGIPACQEITNSAGYERECNASFPSD